MTPDLQTTNLMLTLIAAASVLQALLFLGMAIGGLIMYRRVTQVVAELQTREIAPLRERVDSILADVRTITATVSQRTERVDEAIAGTMERVDETAERVKHSVRYRVSRITGVVRGVRAIVASILAGGSRHEPPAPAAGRI
ncbi:MAG TPA: hypothetical protein VD833_26600 [Vicinamibacterales bacterium]|nr:hypothetical protein [Vicinamibacterales bacterium]